MFLGHDAKRNYQSVAGFSKNDAEAFPAYEKMLTNIAERLEPLLETVPPQLPSPHRNTGVMEKVSIVRKTKCRILLRKIAVHPG